MDKPERKRNTRKSTQRVTQKRKSTLYMGYITNYQSPESIVKILLDKIINLSIRQSLINKINNQIHNYCFEYLQSQVEPILELKYINYTKKNYNKDIYFWKKEKPVESEWVEISEPGTGDYDRFEGAFTHMKEFESKTKKPAISRIKEGLENDTLSLDTIEGKTQDENEKNKNNKNIQARKRPTNMDNNENINNINNNKEEEKAVNKSKIQNQPNPPVKAKASKKMMMFNFPSIDIPDIDREFKHEEYDPPDVNKLRKEIEEEIKKKEKEKKHRIDASKQVKKKEEIEKNNKKSKPLDSNKFTFDSNGKIISFKHYRIESLTKDFTFVKNSIKENDVKPANKKKKGQNQANEKNEKNETENDDKKNEDIIKNPLLIEEEEKKEKSKNEKNNEKKEKIIPSGSNFQLILPNIGVVIKENQNIKEGGREFNKFFNKYSINDYDKILKEYVPLQNKSKIRSKMELMSLNTTNNLNKKTSESVDNTKNNTSQNLNNQSKTFNYNYDALNTNNNPLLTTNDLQINNSIDNNIMMSTSPYLKTSIGNSFNKPNNNYNYNPLMTSFMNYSQGKRGYSLNNSIQMKKPGLASLKIEIDSMQDLKGEKTYYGPDNIKQKNIFRKNITRNYKIGLTKPLGNYYFSSFNKNILTDVNWGNEMGEKGKNKNKNNNTIFARHHTKQQALRELGSTIFSGLKIKLPRDRKVELNK